MIKKNWNTIVEGNLKPRFSLDITPLIDIVFLLVAFFMLTSSLGKDQAIVVDLPKAQESKEVFSKELTLSIQTNGNVYIDRDLVKKAEYKKKIREHINKMGKESIKNIIIRGDKGSPYEVVIGIMDTLSSMGVKNSALAISRD